MGNSHPVKLVGDPDPIKIGAQLTLCMILLRVLHSCAIENDALEIILTVSKKAEGFLNQKSVLKLACIALYAMTDTQNVAFHMLEGYILHLCELYYPACALEGNRRVLVGLEAFLSF